MDLGQLRAILFPPPSWASGCTGRPPTQDSRPNAPILSPNGTQFAPKPAQHGHAVCSSSFNGRDRDVGTGFNAGRCGRALRHGVGVHGIGDTREPVQAPGPQAGVGRGQRALLRRDGSRRPKRADRDSRTLGPAKRLLRKKACSRFAFWLAASIAAYWSFALGLFVLNLSLAL